MLDICSKCKLENPTANACIHGADTEKPKKQRKLIQIAFATFGHSEDIDTRMYVLCDDGTVWWQDTEYIWRQYNLSKVENAVLEEEEA